MTLISVKEAKEAMERVLAELSAAATEASINSKCKTSFYNAVSDDTENESEAECIFGEISLFGASEEDGIVLSFATGIFTDEDGAVGVSTEDLSAQTAKLKEEFGEFIDEVKLTASELDRSAAEIISKKVNEEAEELSEQRIPDHRKFYLTAGIGALLLLLIFSLIKALAK